MTKKFFNIKGMHCPSCKMLIESELGDIEGISEYEVNLDSGEASVVYDQDKLDVKSIFSSIEALGDYIVSDEATKISNENGNSKSFIIGMVVAVLIIGSLISIVLGGGGLSKEKVGNLASAVEINDDFLGDRGETVEAVGENIMIDEDLVNDGDMHTFNYYSEKDGKYIYFFIVKADDGTYRVVANACEVCFGEKKGFSQVGDLIKCNNCGTTYQKSSIAKEKGGCNPGPIDSDAKIVSNQLQISVDDIEAVSNLF